MRVTQAEQLILENQRTIMETLSTILYDGAGSGKANQHFRTGLTAAISKTLTAIDSAKIWPEGS